MGFDLGKSAPRYVRNAMLNGFDADLPIPPTYLDQQEESTLFRFLPGHGFPPLDRPVHVDRVDLNADAPPS